LLQRDKLPFVVTSLAVIFADRLACILADDSHDEAAGFRAQDISRAALPLGSGRGLLTPDIQEPELAIFFR
jgi:hypothetical protein